MNNFAEQLKNYTDNKTICILGFGREGRSTFNMLRKYCSPKSVTIADLNTIDRNTNNIPDNVDIICGEGYQESLNRFDIVFKSPGIVLNHHPSELNCEITSETQFFFSVFRSQIVGITGTKGKSTVTSLTYHILKESGRDCLIAGNIGIPVFDIADSVNDDTIIVCELSCHQLEYMTVSPHIAVFLNLYEEHLDHYGTLENYYNAKKNIYLHQQEVDWLFCNYDIIPDKASSMTVSMSASDHDASVYIEGGVVHGTSSEFRIPTDKIKLLGIHNHYNIGVVYEICCYFEISDEDFEKALCTFSPLSHRLEYVDTVKGIRWYDDSISTACATAIEALKSVPEPATILIGGMDRGIDYSELVDFLSHFTVNVICMETSGKRVYNMIRSTDHFDSPQRVHYTEHLDEAVKLASEITPEGKSCVLSPAAASYGIFKNFEERGDAFKKLIAELK